MASRVNLLFVKLLYHFWYIVYVSRDLPNRDASAFSMPLITAFCCFYYEREKRNWQSHYCPYKIYCLCRDNGQIWFFLVVFKLFSLLTFGKGTNGALEFEWYTFGSILEALHNLFLGKVRLMYEGRFLEVGWVDVNLLILTFCMARDHLLFLRYRKWRFYH